MKYNLLFLLFFLAFGCSKDPKCKDLIEFPCFEYDGENITSSLEGTYGCEDVCVYTGMDTYSCQGTRTGITTTDANGGNIKGGGYYGGIIFKSDYHSYTNPTFRINTPILPEPETEKLTINEQKNERIQHFNSKQKWKLGNRQTNKNDEYLSIAITFDCSERISGISQYQLFFDTDDELLDTESFIEIENFEMERENGEISYDITFVIDSDLYDPNCIRNCKRERFEAKWRAIFSLPEK